MRISRIFMSGIFGLALVISGVAIGADKADKTAKEDAADAEGGATAAKKPPKGDVLYSQQFEEEDDTDAFSSDNGEIEWQKGGANGSKGCLKIFNPGEEGYVVAEKYIQWEDAKTVMDFDYKVEGFNDELYAQGWGAKVNSNVRVAVKGFVKGKWAHAQMKAASMSWMGKSGKNDTFRNWMVIAAGMDKESKDPNLMLDNIVLTATGAKKAATEE